MRYEETEELRQWLLNDEYFFNAVNGVLNSFEAFKLTVEKFIKVLNSSYDFLNFKVNEINFKSLFNYFNDY